MFKKICPNLMTKAMSACVLLASAHLQAHDGLNSGSQDGQVRNNIITLSATAQRKVANDEIHASLYVAIQNPEATVVAKKITQILNKNLALAKSYPSIKVKTGHQSTYPQYNKENQITGWEGRAQIELVSQDFVATAKLIAKLQESMKLANMRFQVSDKTKESIEAELMVEASKKFQQRVNRLLSVWQANDYQLVSLNFNGSGGQFHYAPMVQESMSLRSSVPQQDFASGETNIQMTANGSVQLK